MRPGLVGVALVAAWLPAAAAGQASVRSVHMVADLTGADGAARVRIEVELDAVSPGATVAATALEFAGARVEGVHLARDAEEVPLDRPRPLATEVRLPVGSDPGGGGGEVVAAYTVPGAVVERGGRVRVHVPVLNVALPPEAASPGLFHAELRLPSGWRVAEGFPTGLRAAEAADVWTVELAVVPAVVSLRARTDGRWRPALKDLLDVAALVLVAGFSLMGWRHLRADA